MKHSLALLLALLIIVGLCSCRAEQTAVETTVPTQVPSETGGEPTVLPEPETQPPTEAPKVEGELYLNVSGITFSLVGESENVYCGTVPAELVTWQSDDESVITVENGVLTAVGVGSTTVWGEYGDLQVSCAAGCLAQTQEELEGLDPEILRSPKRLPPILENPPLEYFDEVALVGDSISYILFQYEGMTDLLGHPLFLVRSGTSLNGLVRYYKNVHFRGQDTPIEDAAQLSGVKKLLIMLGQNDLGYRTIEDTMSSWDIMLERILEKSPDMEIIIQSCVQEWIPDNGDNAKNEKIDTYNGLLEEYTSQNGYQYWDIQKYVVDHTGAMATVYSLDKGIHLNQEGCVVWMQVLNHYAQMELLEERNQ